MRRLIAVLATILALIGSASASAQSCTPWPEIAYHAKASESRLIKFWDGADAIELIRFLNTVPPLIMPPLETTGEQAVLVFVRDYMHPQAREVMQVFTLAIGTPECSQRAVALPAHILRMMMHDYYYASLVR